MARNLSSLIIIMTFIVAGCVNQRVSTTVGGDYDESKDQTDHFILPYGSASIPGKWEKTNYNTVSGQQIFVNKDSIRIAIAFNRFDKYEFNSDGSKKGYDFIKAFYDWDSKYFIDSYGLEGGILESDSISNYIIYKIFGVANESSFDTYFLIGEKNGNVNNFSVTKTDKWTEDFKIDFLKGLYEKE